MKSIAERHKFILEKLERKGFVTVLELSKELEVSLPTIRKDLEALENKNLLVRSHGSASQVKSRVMDLNIRIKEEHNIAEKTKIAASAQELIVPDDAIILASGSTVTAFAKILRPLGSLNVVTPSLGIALIVNEKDNVNVNVLGGKLYKNSLSVRGEYAVYGLKNINCSKLFIGCDGIDTERGITCATTEEASLTNAMMEVSDRTVVLADSTKFGRRGFGKICPLEDIDVIVTDEGIKPEMKEHLENIGVKVVIAR